MAGKRWLFSALGLALICMLIAFGTVMLSTASASPAQQVATSTITTTATQPITSTVTTTATTIVTETSTTTATPTATTTSTTTATPTAIVTATSTAVPTTTTTPTVTPNPLSRPFWSFSAKFVCGEQLADQSGQPIPGEPAVKPGNYATEINIHNPHYLGPIQIRQKALLLVDRGVAVGRAPAVSRPGVFSPLFALPDDGATMMDCNGIWELLNPGVTPPASMPLMIGYLVIVSPANLDVVGVTTATTSTSNLEPAGIALENFAVEGKRVLIPSTAFPDRVLPRNSEFTDE